MSGMQMLLSDPVVWGSFLGLGVVLGICGYYVWYFMSHIANADQEQQH